MILKIINSVRDIVPLVLLISFHQLDEFEKLNHYLKMPAVKMTKKNPRERFPTMPNHVKQHLFLKQKTVSNLLPGSDALSEHELH